MTYVVKEAFYTLQGEGFHSGRSAVFLRFAGCNLWTGREADRMDAVCKFCDTDFVGIGPDGGKFANADTLARAMASRWPVDRERGGRRFIVCTGGEPLLQLDGPALDALHAYGFEVAVETNGTIAALRGLDWICVSPKADAPLVQRSGDELKLVYPQERGEPERFEQLDFAHFFLQPMDGPHMARNAQLASQYCLSNPRWRLSTQTHKLLGLR
ncbi:MAG TPA: 7-carboxy-7-deazaguanine synthase [Gemmatimonadaceae bacterium]|nr:7-carboxy-7-deazaguanine synthase [Gemmatimonadaceae bacterium]